MRKPSALVSATETRRFSSTTRGLGAISATVGSFVGSASVPPAPSGVSVVAGVGTGLPSGLVPVSEVSVVVTGLPLPSRMGVPVLVTALPVAVAVFST